jgi:hypothetical protein
MTGSFYNSPIMGEVGMYSKTRLGSDQIEGSLSLTPRGKRIVYIVVAVIVAACAAVGIWSAVSSDPLSTSANGCVSVTIASSTGGSVSRYCGAQAKTFCHQEFQEPGSAALAAQHQCDLAGLTKAKVASAG